MCRHTREAISATGRRAPSVRKDSLCASEPGGKEEEGEAAVEQAITPLEALGGARSRWR